MVFNLMNPTDRPIHIAHVVLGAVSWVGIRYLKIQQMVNLKCYFLWAGYLPFLQPLGCHLVAVM